RPAGGRSFAAERPGGGLGSTRPMGRATAAPQPGARPHGAAAPAPVGGRSMAGIKLRSYSPQMPRVLTIGTSTGGPQALAVLFGQIGRAIDRVPVLVTQHMPPTFTAILAEHMAKVAGRPAHEGQEGEVVKPGTIYVAPGGKHMTVEKSGADVVIRLNDGPPVNFCKPAVDPLFDSVAKAYGSATLALVLTGMGNDGENGTRTIARAGGSIIAQDEASSVVWGMPGAAAHTGECSEVLPLDQIGPKVTRILGGQRL
ncbi:chemotaxis protein CheB, partial [Rhodobium orientis]